MQAKIANNFSKTLGKHDDVLDSKEKSKTMLNSRRTSDDKNDSLKRNKKKTPQATTEESQPTSALQDDSLKRKISIYNTLGSPDSMPESKHLKLPNIH